MRVRDVGRGLFLAQGPPGSAGGGGGCPPGTPIMPSPAGKTVQLSVQPYSSHWEFTEHDTGAE